MKAAGRTAAFIRLARSSNLPSVWTNSLTAWILAGGTASESASLWILLCGGSLVYAGGAVLNDAFDVEFDRRHRPERPIPAGLLSTRSVWITGLLALAAGSALLAWRASPGLAAALAIAILFYDGIHKKWVGAVWIMAACRALLACVVASAAAPGSLPGLTNLLHAGALFVHTAAITYTARSESSPGHFRRWPLFLLMAPLPASFALRIPPEPWFWIAATALLGWTLVAVARLRGSEPARIGRCVAALLAGFILVDALFLAQSSPVLLPIAGALFGFTLLLQRSIPAT
ncbi:MAG TPA: UbiA family prenyltransferase [Verrucomicrobiales bacterium]|nr:UbiA family prenyltransferase [Verrucomicrobiales bacterium]